MPIRRTSIFVGGLLAMSLSGLARADDTSTSGMCSGSGGTGTGMWTIAGTANLSVKDVTILGGSGSPFGRAECECRSRDISMRIQLSQQIPQALGASVAATAWMGAADCSSSTNRTQTNTQCETVSENSPPGSKTKVDTSAFTTVGQFYVSIPAESLVNPKPVNIPGAWNYICDPDFMASTGDLNKSPGANNQSRTAYVIVGDNQSTANCNLPIIVNMSPPQKPTEVQVGSGDGALAVSWTIPQGAASIENYQLLCRRKSDKSAVMSADFLSSTLHWFSACMNGTLFRRPMPGLMENMMVSPPTGVVPPPPSTKPADDFEVRPEFICSDRVPANGSSLAQRIEGLENGVEYEVRVVSIDYFGNPSASETMTGVPLPTLDLLTPFCEANGGTCPAGFGCEMTRRGLPSWPGGLLVLSLLGLLLRPRRTAVRVTVPSKDVWS